jgi:hypothetical protein
MKIRAISFYLLLFSFLFSIVLANEEEPELHSVMKMELKRLEELWNVLDQCAEKVWPGWTGYKEVPFLFEYENGVRMLVGHPNPPEGFELVEGIDVNGKKVYLDRRSDIPLELKWPTSGGGGPGPFGMHEGKMVETVDIGLRSLADSILEFKKAQKDKSKEEKEEMNEMQFASEGQILLYVHELFHVFQQSFYKYRYGNLRYNPDTNYAVYSEIEGEALQQAFLEKDDAAAKAYIKDFVVARKLKHNSMAEIEQKQEMEDEFMEGTAVYATYAALQQIVKDYNPIITEKDDPYFFGFKNPHYFFDKELKSLEYSKGDTFGSSGKCYQYGCFQALLLSRFATDWQKMIPGKYHFLYDIIVDYLRMDEEEENQVAQRLNEKYGYDSLFSKHDKEITARDTAFSDFYSQKGKLYIVNFKLTHEFPRATDRNEEKIYRRGINLLYPNGVREIKIKEVLVEGKEKPMAIEQIYHLRYVDTENQDYTIESSRQEGDIYYDAVVTTNGFTLKAPKIRVKEREKRVKFIILSKVKEE